jgi:hypothetical protein
MLKGVLIVCGLVGFVAAWIFGSFYVGDRLARLRATSDGKASQEASRLALEAEEDRALKVVLDPEKEISDFPEETLQAAERALRRRKSLAT